jgi:hypothetical protein
MRGRKASIGRRVWRAFAPTLNKLFVGTCLVVVAAEGPSAAEAVKQRFGSPPRPVLRNVAEFVPDGYRVAQRLDVEMDGVSPPEVVLHLADPRTMLVDQTVSVVLVVAWDTGAQRWTTVFDSARPALLGIPPYTPKPLIPTKYGVDAVRLSPVASRSGHTDVLVSVDLNLVEHVTGILAFDGVVARPVHVSVEPGATVDVIGSPPRQQVRLVTMEGLSTGGNYGRSYEQRLAPYMYDGALRYRAVRDTRPIAGITVLIDDQPGAVIRDVDADGPASGLILPGDVVTEVRRGHPADWTPGDLGPLATLEACDAGQAVTLVVRRDGERIVVPLLLASRGDGGRAAEHADLGGHLWTARAGVLVADAGRGALAKAGLRVGDVVTAVDGFPVRRPADVDRALYNSYAEFGMASDEPQTVRLRIRRGSRVFATTLRPRWRTLLYDEEKPGGRDVVADAGVIPL